MRLIKNKMEVHLTTQLTVELEIETLLSSRSMAGILPEVLLFPEYTNSSQVPAAHYSWYTSLYISLFFKVVGGWGM